MTGLQRTKFGLKNNIKVLEASEMTGLQRNSSTKKLSIFVLEASEITGLQRDCDEETKKQISFGGT